MTELPQMTEKRQIHESSEELQYQEAVSLMENGNARAKTKVAYYKLLGYGGGEVDKDEAVALLEERVKDRDSDAMWMLGLCCEYGIGTEQDIKRAKLLYGRSRKARNDVGNCLWWNVKEGRGNAVLRLRGL